MRMLMILDYPNLAMFGLTDEMFALREMGKFESCSFRTEGRVDAVCSIRVMKIELPD